MTRRRPQRLGDAGGVRRGAGEYLKTLENGVPALSDFKAAGEKQAGFTAETPRREGTTKKTGFTTEDGEAKRR